MVAKTELNNSINTITELTEMNTELDDSLHNTNTKLKELEQYNNDLLSKNNILSDDIKNLNKVSIVKNFPLGVKKY